jgi:hypothetical protein
MFAIAAARKMNAIEQTKEMCEKEDSPGAARPCWRISLQFYETKLGCRHSA